MHGLMTVFFNSRQGMSRVPYHFLRDFPLLCPRRLFHLTRHDILWKWLATTGRVSDIWTYKTRENADFEHDLSCGKLLFSHVFTWFKEHVDLTWSGTSGFHSKKHKDSQRDRQPTRDHRWLGMDLCGSPEDQELSRTEKRIYTLMISSGDMG